MYLFFSSYIQIPPIQKCAYGEGPRSELGTFYNATSDETLDNGTKSILKQVYLNFDLEIQMERRVCIVSSLCDRIGHFAGVVVWVVVVVVGGVVIGGSAVTIKAEMFDW